MSNVSYVIAMMLLQVETIGDAYMGVGGCPNESKDHAINAVEMALSMVMGTGMIATPKGHKLQIRAGTQNKLM